MYKSLVPSKVSYINDFNSLDFINTISIVRGELLDLNYKPWSKDISYICTTCNKSEDVFHFIGICPIFNYIRKKYFGQILINNEELITMLKENKLKEIYLYVKEALRYRRLLLSEFE